MYADQFEIYHGNSNPELARKIARWLGTWDGPPLLLNVNVPNLPYSEMHGAAIVPPVPWGHVDRAGFTARPAEGGGWLLTARAARPHEVTDDSNTDAGAVAVDRFERGE